MENTKTRDHDTIKNWVEERNGKPTVVEETAKNKEGGGLLRIQFDEEEDDLKEISWDKFFTIFDDNDLQFLYEKGNKESRFCKFVKE